MNPQEQFWAGEFGDEYAKRSLGSVSANIALFGRILARTEDVRSVIEFGAGVGSNLQAFMQLLPGAALTGIEINEKAFDRLGQFLAEVPHSPIHASMLDPATPWGEYGLAFTKGVLIHIAPEDLPRAYEVLHRASSRYILVAEYYSPKPIEIEYRGHSARLWRRDFAGEMLDRFNDLRLIDYGFVYHRDPYPQDDLTWWLLSKGPL